MRGAEGGGVIFLEDDSVRGLGLRCCAVDDPVGDVVVMRGKGATG